ncbi:MAG: helix-turn-helix domain-containing protein [Candidatus Micrarchaeaceae archaeon]|jgi:putative transcriptional regulator|nr:helix-turn-helix domain-containing protein [Candidatus Micrarchaeota archaeon]HII10006.1 helix-turn-helix domain-containing protein [Candidatus Micrarchaeota archaeon]
MDELREKIAGEITLAESPGSAMKKWREFFGVTQVELAKQIKVSTSTISDYESNRRLSPGVGVIKRFVEALFTIDAQKGGTVSNSLAKFSSTKEEEDKYYKIHDFGAPINAADFNRIIEGKVVANPGTLDSINLFGYTKLDSLRIILEMSPAEYPKLFGSTTERVFIFEHVSTGRSPLVVIRVAPIKPRVVVIHNVTTLDKLAVKIAQVEKIPLIVTKLDIDKLYERLDKI